MWKTCGFFLGSTQKGKTTICGENVGQIQKSFSVHGGYMERNPQEVWITFLCGGTLFPLHGLPKQQAMLWLRSGGSVLS